MCYVIKELMKRKATLSVSAGAVGCLLGPGWDVGIKEANHRDMYSAVRQSINNNNNNNRTTRLTETALPRAAPSSSSSLREGIKIKREMEMSELS